MVVLVDVPQVYAQIASMWSHVQVSPFVVVHALNHSVVCKAKEVSISWIVHIVEGPDLNDVIWRVI